MDGPDEAYDPAALYARGTVTRQDDEDEGGIGQRAEKHATATLRIFGSNLGPQWLMYGGVGGGTQDEGDRSRAIGQSDGPARPGLPIKVRCDWFRFYYQGIVDVAGVPTFGRWTVEVRGKWLEKTAFEIAKQVRPTLRVGKLPDGETKIDSITIGLLKLERQKGAEGEEE